MLLYRTRVLVLVQYDLYPRRRVPNVLRFTVLIYRRVI